MAEQLPPGTTAPPPARGWGKIVLIASLGLNLLFVGAIGGALLRDGAHGRGAMVRELNFGTLTDALAREDREALRRAFQDAAPDLRGQRQAIRRDMTELLTALRAPDFQRDRVEALFLRQNERAGQRHKLGQDLVLQMLVAMTPEARAAFADRLETAMKRARRPAGP